MTAQPMQKQKMKVGHISGNTSSLIFDIVNTILLLMVCVITLYPFLNTVAISFNDSTDAVYGGIYLWPRVFSLRSYETILLQSSTIPHSALISALRAVIGTALSIPLSMMLAYVMSRRDFVLRSAVTKLVLFTMYVSGGLIPTYLVYRMYGLTNNFLVYILPSAVSAYNIILIKTFIEQLPTSLEEAAMIDGAGYMTIFVRVIFPLSIPIVATIAIFAAVGQWNSWFDNHIYNTNNDALLTLQYQLYQFLNESQRIAELLRQGNIHDVEAAVSQQLTPKGVRVTTTLFAAVPIFLVYPFMQRYFIKGIMIGAVKG